MQLPDLTNEQFNVQRRLVEVLKKDNTLKYAPLGRSQGCSSKQRDVLTFGQVIVHEMCKILSLRGNLNRGIVVLHSTGSGKTCAAVAAMDAFWKSGRTLFYVSTVAGLRSNPPNNFAMCVSDLFKNASRDGIARRVVFLTFAKFAHILSNPGSNESYVKKLARSLVIVDEVHNLFNPLPTQRAEHEEIVSFFTGRHPKSVDFDTKYVIMTATPGNNPIELVELLNIVRDRRRPPLQVPNFMDGRSMARFARDITGLISYIDLSNDNTVFPQIIEEEIVEAPMRMPQFQQYVDQFKKTVNTRDTDFDELSKTDSVYRYWIGARKYANTVFNYDFHNELHEFSSKLPLLIERVLKFPREKHYVYSAFYERHGFGGHGVVAIAKILTRIYGYQQMTVPEAREYAYGSSSARSHNNNNHNDQTILQRLPAPMKRFVIMIPSELRGSSTSDSYEQESVEAIRRIFNSDANAHGELIHVMLASNSYNEGIDLRAVRHIHFLEPLVSYNMEKQGIGRAVRHCSHAQLKKEYGEWTVTIHRYLSTAPPLRASFVDIGAIHARVGELVAEMQQTNDVHELRSLKADYDTLQAALADAETSINSTEETIDHFIYKEARARYKDMAMLQLAIMSASVDCMATKSFHGNKIPCIGELA